MTAENAENSINPEGRFVMFNPAIIVALIVQSIVSKASRRAGAVIGFLITTGILIWGLGSYSDGYQIAFFGIPLSLPVFLLACLVWYGFDTKEFMASQKEAEELGELSNSPLLQSGPVVRFYKTTQEVWASGKLPYLGKIFENEGKVPYSDFIKKYMPLQNSALRIFFDRFPPREGEFLVGLGNLQNASFPAWFVLTNLRLIQRDGRNDDFKEVDMGNVNTYKVSGINTKTMVFKMKSGEEITFEKVQMYPVDKFLSGVISEPSKA